MISPAPISTLRLVLRIANGFSLDLLRVYRGDRDFTDALILAALMQRKAAALASEPEGQRRHAAFDTPVPEHLRGYISISGLAASLGIPFETVRRRARRMIADGLCETTQAGEGLRISPGLLQSDGHRQALLSVYEVVRTLYHRLLRANCLQLMDLPSTAAVRPLDGEPPVRIVWRAAADYFLRTMEMLLPHFAHLTQALVLQAVVRGNTEALPDSMRGDDRMDVDALVPDSQRRPVRASEVAKRLGVPHETTRRNLAVLMRDGRCLRVAGGHIVPTAVLAQDDVAAAYAPNFQNLRRMFIVLAESGVLARWERDREMPGSAA